jgi:hypothetical protein
MNGNSEHHSIQGEQNFFYRALFLLERAYGEIASSSIFMVRDTFTLWNRSFESISSKSILGDLLIEQQYPLLLKGQGKSMLSAAILGLEFLSIEREPGNLTVPAASSFSSPSLHRSICKRRKFLNKDM